MVGDKCPGCGRKDYPDMAPLCNACRGTTSKPIVGEVYRNGSQIYQVVAIAEFLASGTLVIFRRYTGGIEMKDLLVADDARSWAMLMSDWMAPNGGTRFVHAYNVG